MLCASGLKTLMSKMHIAACPPRIPAHVCPAGLHPQCWMFFLVSPQSISTDLSQYLHHQISDMIVLVMVIPYMVSLVHAQWRTLNYRHSGMAGVVVSSRIAGREHPEMNL